MCLIWLFAVAKAEDEKAQICGQQFCHAAKAEYAYDTVTSISPKLVFAFPISSLMYLALLNMSCYAD